MALEYDSGVEHPGGCLEGGLAPADEDPAGGDGALLGGAGAVAPQPQVADERRWGVNQPSGVSRTVRLPTATTASTEPVASAARTRSRSSGEPAATRWVTCSGVSPAAAIAAAASAELARSIKGRSTCSRGTARASARRSAKLGQEPSATASAGSAG